MFWLGFVFGIAASIAVIAAVLSYVGGRPYMPGPFSRPKE